MPALAHRYHDADGDARQETCGDQHDHRMGTREEQASDKGRSKAGKQNGLAPVTVGKLPRDQQRQQQTEDVGGEDDGQRGRREADRGLPAHIERRSRVRQNEDGGDDPGGRPHTPRGMGFVLIGGTSGVGRAKG